MEVEGPDSSHKFAADLLIGADGSMSETWRKFNPHGQRRRDPCFGLPCFEASEMQ